MRYLSPQLLAASLLLTLTACGGGGGGGNDEPANVAPTVNAGTDQTVNEAIAVTLAGSATDSDGSVSTYAWTQLSGPTVSLTNAGSASANFVAPGVSAATVLTFRLTATDNDGASASDDVQVTVNAVPGTNTAPTANAGSDFNGVINTTVNLTGTGTDSDGSITAYSWQQTAGTPTVTLNNANTANASFTAPASPTTLTFRLTVTDNETAIHFDDVVVTIIDAPATVTVSGKATFDRAVHNTSTNALNLNAPVVSNVRGAVVELVNGSNTVLASTSTDANGDYSFNDVAPNTSNLRVRVKAQMLRTGTPAWNFQIVDNTNSKALYSMVTANFNVTTSNVTQNLHAALGTGTTYLNTRASAPFAVLDSVYDIVQKVIAADANFVFASLNLNWSVNNVAASGDKTTGNIGTSHFDGTEIYLLGKANNDTDEFDDHVVIHEWGHYFEGFHSRSDSIGGQHGGGDKLDMRVAFGEGFGNAWSGIITDDPFYRDSYGSNSANGFSINVETNAAESPGWASESNVQGILYDLYDSGSEAGDGVALGMAPILATLVNEEKNTTAATSIFSFIQGLKSHVNAGEQTSIDSILNARAITATGLDEFGSSEVNNGGNSKVLPVYFTLTPGSSVSNVCSIPTYGQYNKLGVHRFIKFTISSTANRTVSVPALAADSDVDFVVYRNGVDLSGNAGATNGNNQGESWTANLQPGVYVIDIYEYNNFGETGNRESCFTVSLN